MRSDSGVKTFDSIDKMEQFRGQATALEANKKRRLRERRLESTERDNYIANTTELTASCGNTPEFRSGWDRIFGPSPMGASETSDCASRR